MNLEREKQYIKRIEDLEKRNCRLLDTELSTEKELILCKRQLHKERSNITELQDEIDTYKERVKGLEAINESLITKVDMMEFRSVGKICQDIAKDRIKELEEDVESLKVKCIEMDEMKGKLTAENKSLLQRGKSSRGENDRLRSLIEVLQNTIVERNDLIAQWSAKAAADGRAFAETCEDSLIADE